MNDETTEEATPRTDALWLESGLFPQTTTEKWLDAHCRIMERELTKAKSDLRRAIEIGEELTCLGLLANSPTELITRK